MGIGATPGNEGLLLLASILAFIALPVLFLAATTIVGLVERVLGIKSGIPGLALLLAIPGALLAASLLLDQGGEVLPGQVIEKTEQLVVNDDGGWSDRLSLVLRYSMSGRPLPAFTSTANALSQAMDRSSPQELVTLATGAADFDRVRPGDTVELRVLRVEAFFSLVRLANQSTETLVPWAYVEAAVGMVAVAFVAWRLRRTSLGYGPIIFLVLVALAAPLAYAYRTWSDREDLSGATERATATIKATTRVTTVSLSSEGGEESTINVLQPYDVVQLAFVPSGYRDMVIAVDAVDAPGGQPSRFEAGAPIDVVYVPGDPRNARILDQTRTHYLKTTLGFYLQGGAVVLGIVVLAVIAGTLGRIGRKMIRSLLLPGGK
jgi:hypothetical protein